MSDKKSPMKLVANAVSNLTTLSQRSFRGMFGVSHDGKRDLNTIYGYKTQRTYQDYFETYRYQDIAQRIVAGIAKSCWSQKASLVVVDGEDEEEILQDDMNTLKRMGLFAKLQRADILNRIGSFSVLYIGVPDGLDPKEPLGKSNNASIGNVFFAPYNEEGVEITQYEDDILSPRHGLPVLYSLSFTNFGEKKKDQARQTRVVHWTRIVHMAEGNLDSEIEGASALEPILNRLNDINKTVGGASEAYFRNARGKTSFETNPQYQGTFSVDQKEALHKEAEEFTNDWKDYIALAGMQAKALDTPHASPEHTFRAAVELISGQTGIPIRQLLGVGPGQAAGSEDKITYNQLIAERQEQECSLWLMNALLILSVSGVIGKIREDAQLNWEIPQALSEKEEADIGEIRSRTLLNISSSVGGMGGLAGIVQPEEALKQIMKSVKIEDVDDDGFDEDEAIETIDGVDE